MARQRSGFGWPVYAAFVILALGRLAYALIGSFETAGLVAVIALIALALVAGGVSAWHSRRQIRDWASKEPPNDKA